VIDLPSKMRSVYPNVETSLGYSPSFLARTCGSTDAVNVLLNLTGHIIVDHCLDPANVETTRGEVGGEQKVGFAGSKLGQCVESL
jgi:hypothetical protein